MANVLKPEKQEQVRALGRLGWSLRRIEEATRVRRETVSRYLKEAEIPIRAERQRRLEGSPSSPAGQVTTDLVEESNRPVNRPPTPSSDEQRRLPSHRPGERLRGELEP
jgi:hypothetical protein